MSVHLIVGLAIMAWGLVLTLDNFGVVEADRYWRLWPLILVAIGLVRLLESARRGNAPFALSGVLFTFVGLALLMSTLEIVSFKTVWPLLVLAFGATIVGKTLLRARGAEKPRDWRDGLSSQDSPAGDGAAGNRLDAFTFMGGMNHRTASQEFTGGSAVAVLGGCEIDLRQASLANGRATLDTFAMWGGIEIKVPEDWAVESHVVPVLGGFEDKSHPPVDPKQRLVLTGVAIMGGVAVKN
jgi:predicted membrane protein